MKALVIEDEPLVCDYLASLVAKLTPAIEVIDSLDTVKSAIEWFNTNRAPDIVFMDVRLADGLSFEIFDSVNITCPVIFTTAYDEYAIRAFKVNSIDYLLKPVTLPALEAAIQKLQSISKTYVSFINSNMLPALKQDTRTGYKTRFVVKIGEHLRMIPVGQVCCFLSQEKTSWVRTKDGRQYPLDTILDAISDCVDPRHFFRINRKYLVALDSIADIIVYSGSRLMVKMHNYTAEDTIVSRERVSDFRAWIEG